MEKIGFSFRVFITDKQGGITEVFPLNGQSWVISYEPRGENVAGYVKKLSGKMKYYGADFDFFHSLNTGADREFPLVITLKKYLDGVETGTLFTGRISLQSGTWNLDKRFVEFPTSTDNEYQIIEDKSGDKVNILSHAGTKYTVSHLKGTIQESNCNAKGVAGTPVTAECMSEVDGWAITFSSYEVDAVDGDWIRSVTRAREVLDVADGVNMPEPWILIRASGPRRYARRPFLFNKVTTFNEQGLETFSYDIFDGTIDNGVKLGEVIQILLSQMGTGLTVKSEFFQINPDTPTAVNYVTGLASEVNNLIVFQKSDVKRYRALENASRMEITFEELIGDLCTQFNLKYRIEGSVFRLEHVSYFTREHSTMVLKTSDPEFGSKVGGMRSFKYNGDDLPKRETFKYYEPESRIFESSGIFYPGAVEGESKPHRTAITFNDVQKCMDNPNEGPISDDGIVIIATDSGYGVISEASTETVSGFIFNSPLTWKNLLKKYHRHERARANFTLDGESLTALSVRPTKIQDRLNVDLGVEKDFDPDLLIDSDLGPEGVVMSAQYTLYKTYLSIELGFPA